MTVPERADESDHYEAGFPLACGPWNLSGDACREGVSLWRTPVPGIRVGNPRARNI